MQPQESGSVRETLPATISLGSVRLRVADLERSLRFYRDILGYQVSTSDGDDLTSVFPARDHQGPPHFELREVPGAAPASRHSPGLYHAAILLPTRVDLARVAMHLRQSGVPFGHSDHAVSEALYLDDPDGNGLEIYADRPREAWPLTDEGVAMTLDPIDFSSLLGEISGPDDIWRGMPEGTIIGHLHLRVSDLEAAHSFYVDVLGFEPMMTTIPGALFISVGGYHHHLGLNVWESRGGWSAGEDHAGLDQFVISVPDAGSLDAVERRLESHGVDCDRDGESLAARDPDGTRIVTSAA
ncbi:MAG: VOC family protein [Chloroflexota bacterium]